MVDSLPLPNLPAAKMQRAPADVNRKTAKEPRDRSFDKELTRHEKLEARREDPRAKTESVPAPNKEEAKSETQARDQQAVPAPLPALEILLAQALQAHGHADHGRKTSNDDSAPAETEPKEQTQPRHGKRINGTGKGSAPEIELPASRDGLTSQVQSANNSLGAMPQAEPVAEQPTARLELHGKREQESSPESAGKTVAKTESPSVEPLLPTPPPSPQQKVEFRPPAEQILDQLAAPAKAVLSDTPAQKPVMKMLQFDLKPEALGAVQVTLRLAGGKMEIEIAPRERETEALLRADAQLVDQVVRAVTAAGDVSAVTVNITDRETGEGAAGNWSTASGDESRQSQQRAGSESGGSSSSRDEVKHHAHHVAEPVENSAQSRQPVLRPRVV